MTTANVPSRPGSAVFDVEHAFQAATTLADWIVTRNQVDYRRSPIPAVTPAQFLKRLRTA